MKIALGTVQFGLDYGISNTTGKITPEMAAEILSFAAGNGIGPGKHIQGSHSSDDGHQDQGKQLLVFHCKFLQKVK